MRSSQPTPPPVEGILTVLDEGKASGTHKFVVLLALIELASSATEPTVSYDAIAEKVVELCWDHVVPFGDRPVAQGPQGDPYFVQTIKELRDLAGQCSYPLIPADLRTSPPWRRSITKIANDLAAMPICRLQNLVGEVETPFLYERDDESRCLTFLPEALEDLTRFGPVIRPLVESRIVRYVMRLRRNDFGAAVEEQVRVHLFGADRVMPGYDLRAALVDLQDSKCLWTGERVTSRSPVDHVLPWARTRLSAVENFVIADPRANSSKSNMLLAPAMTRRWIDHLTTSAAPLAAFASAAGWPTDMPRVLNAYRLQVERAPVGAPLWNGSGNPLVPMTAEVRSTLISYVSQRSVN